MSLRPATATNWTSSVFLSIPETGDGYSEHKPGRNEPQTKGPDRDRNPEGQKQTGQEADDGDKAGEHALVWRQAQRGEVGDRVVDEDGEGAERPRGLYAADRGQTSDDAADHDDGRSGGRAAPAQTGEQRRQIALPAHCQNHS